MDLKRLGYFSVLAEECHFGRAAARLHLAQPSLTEQVRRLEGEIGAPLFNRTSRAVTLTPVGRVLADHVGRLLKEADDLEQVMRAAREGFVGRVVVGFSGAQGYTLLPTALRAFCAEYPGVAILPRIILSGREIDALPDHEVDLSFLRADDEASVRARAAKLGVALDLLQSEAFVLALSRDHPLADKDHISAADLRDEAFVFHAGWADASTNGAVQAVCRDADFEPRIVAEVGDTLSLIALVASGVGVTLVSESFAAIEHCEVVFRPLDEAQGMLVSLPRSTHH